VNAGIEKRTYAGLRFRAQLARISAHVTILNPIPPMPYCPTCHFWTRDKRRFKSKKGCENCGGAWNAGRESLADEVRARVTDTDLIALGGGIAFICAMGALMEGKAVIGILLILWGIFSLGFYFRKRGVRHSYRQAALQSKQSAFAELKGRIDVLKLQSENMQTLLRAERVEAASERATHRIQLLEKALATRQHRIWLLTCEHWARQVQLWLNQVEGFLAEQLPTLSTLNGEALLGSFRLLMVQGRELDRQGGTLEPLEEVPKRARTVLEECLNRAPELEERVKDARVLAAIGDMDGPVEFSAGTTWLHWLQDAIPTLALLPQEFHEDDAYLRIQGELRVMKDSTPEMAPRPPMPAAGTQKTIPAPSAPEPPSAEVAEA
jgi:hypothetical protein